MLKTELARKPNVLRFDPINRCDSDTLAALDVFAGGNLDHVRRIAAGYEGSFPSFRLLLHALTDIDPKADIVAAVPFSYMHGPDVQDFGDFLTVFVPYRGASRIHLFWLDEVAS